MTNSELSEKTPCRIGHVSLDRAHCFLGRKLKLAFSPRLLKKIQVQGGAPISDGYPGPSEAYFPYAATSAQAR